MRGRVWTSALALALALLAGSSVAAFASWHPEPQTPLAPTGQECRGI